MKTLGRLYFIRNLNKHLTCEKDYEFIRSHHLEINDNLYQVNNSLNINGIYLGIKLKKNTLERIKSYAYKNKSYAYHNPKLGFYFNDKRLAEIAIGKPIYISHYFNLLENDEVFRQLTNDLLIKKIVSAYIGHRANLLGCQMWWTFPEVVSDQIKNEYAHYYHRDLDSYKFLKFFFYITDVSEGDGEHCFIRCSHRITLTQQIREKFKIKRFSDDIIHNWFSKDSEVSVVGESGSGSIEDTFGFHKGTSPKNNPRLMLALVYGTKDYGYQQFIQKDLSDIELNAI